MKKFSVRSDGYSAYLAQADQVSSTRRWATDYIEEGYRAAEAKLAEEAFPRTVIPHRAVSASR